MFVRENIQETLDAIKDMKLKQRVSDIVSQIFRKYFVHSNYGTIEDSYSVQEIIGQGSFSTVKRVIHSETSFERAAKIITKYSISDSQKDGVAEETGILKILDHPNIIKIAEVIENTSKIHIITELCQGGELFERIINCKSFSEKQQPIICFRFCLG